MIFKPISFIFFLRLLRLLLFVDVCTVVFELRIRVAFDFVLCFMFFLVCVLSIALFLFIFQCNCHLAQQNTHTPQGACNRLPPKFEFRYVLNNQSNYIHFFCSLSFVGVAHNVYCPISRVWLHVARVSHTVFTFFFVHCSHLMAICIDLSPFTARIETSGLHRPIGAKETTQRHEVCVKEKKM